MKLNSGPHTDFIATYLVKILSKSVTITDFSDSELNLQLIFKDKKQVWFLNVCYISILNIY